MTAAHPNDALLRQFVMAPRGLDEVAALTVESHIDSCAECRRVVSDTASFEAEPDWVAIMGALGLDQSGLEAAGDRNRTRRDPLAVELASLREPIPGRKRRVTRRLQLAAVLIVIVIGAAALGAQNRDRTDIAASGPPGWSEVVPADRDVFTADGPVSIAVVTEWNDQILIVGATQSATVNGRVLAWLSDDGLHWEGSDVLLPTSDLAGNPIGCDVFGGVAVRGDELVLACKVFEDEAVRDRVVVASSRDLEHWSLHGVSELGPYFGAAAATGPDGSVIVEVLSAADPNTTVGSFMRVWTSTDLETWTEIEGSAPDVMVNGQATRIRTVGDTVVLVGGHSIYSDDGRAVTQPALWASVAGAPFQRALLAAPGPGTGSQGNASDVTGSVDRLAVVGLATSNGRGQPAAWSGSFAHGFEPATVQAEATSGSDTNMWSVVPLADGALVAVGGSDLPDSARAWLSADGGTTWTTTAPGPTVAGRWSGQPIGMTQGPEQRFWIWTASSETPGAIMGDE